MLEEADCPEMVFLTGDLGFMALEPLRDAIGPRFINAGVAEQNMIGVAAGLARCSWRPWAYSIAPFIYARPFEQIRNDVCMHRLPVVMVGNGGGYGYGVMGATHHALEDYGTLLTLYGLQAFVPAFDTDIPPIISKLMATQGPAYLRLGVDEAPSTFIRPPYGAWRKVVFGSTATILVCGPLVGGLIAAVMQRAASERPNIWVVSELPVVNPPSAFFEDLRQTEHLLVAEEHVARGGVGEQIAALLLRMGKAPNSFSHHFAVGYPSGRYGSQRFHRHESGLDPEAILAAVRHGVILR